MNQAVSFTGFEDKRNLPIHEGVCVYVCMCGCMDVCVCDILLVNKISQERKVRQFSNLVYRCPLLRERTALFLVEVKGHGGYGGQTLKTSLTRYLELGNLDEVHTWHGDAL